MRAQKCGILLSVNLKTNDCFDVAQCLHSDMRIRMRSNLSI